MEGLRAGTEHTRLLTDARVSVFCTYTYNRKARVALSSRPLCVTLHSAVSVSKSLLRLQAFSQRYCSAATIVLFGICSAPTSLELQGSYIQLGLQVLAKGTYSVHGTPCQTDQPAAFQDCFISCLLSQFLNLCLDSQSWDSGVFLDLWNEKALRCS